MTDIPPGNALVQPHWLQSDAGNDATAVSVPVALPPFSGDADVRTLKFVDF